MNLKNETIDPKARRREKSSEAEVEQWLLQLPDWSYGNQDGVGRLVKTYGLPSYDAVIQMVNAVADWANSANHHPSMVVDYKTLKITWWSHDVGGVHLHDAISAAHCDEIASRWAKD